MCVQVVLEQTHSRWDGLKFSALNGEAFSKQLLPGDVSQVNITFSPMDTPPEVMMTSARLIPSCRADSRSSGLQAEEGSGLEILKNAFQQSNIQN